MKRAFQILVPVLVLAGMTLTAAAEPKGKRPERDPGQRLEDCLRKVCVQYKGKEYCLESPTHYQIEEADGPKSFGGFKLRQGLRTHPQWSTKVDEIDACVRRVGGKKRE